MSEGVWVVGLRGIDLDVMPEGGQELIHIFFGIPFPEGPSTQIVGF